MCNCKIDPINITQNELSILIDALEYIEGEDQKAAMKMRWELIGILPDTYSKRSIVIEQEIKREECPSCH